MLDEAGGVFHVAGTPARTVSWADVAAAATVTASSSPATTTSRRRCPRSRSAPTSRWSRSTPTRAVRRLVRHIACDDAGNLLNPLIADGQVHGGIAEGVAQALMEEIVYDEDGIPKTANFADIRSTASPSCRASRSSTWPRRRGSTSSAR